MSMKPINFRWIRTGANFSGILKNFVQHRITHNFPQIFKKIIPVLLAHAFGISGPTKLV